MLGKASHRPRWLPTGCARAALAFVTLGCGPRVVPTLPDSGGSGGTNGSIVDAADGGVHDAMNEVSDAVDADDAEARVSVDPRFEVFCVQARAALVERVSRCGGWSRPVAAAWVNNDPCKWWGAAIQGERMVFDGANADACLAEMRALSCHADQVPGVCARGLWGALKPGTRCNMPAQQLLSECVADAICVSDQTGCVGTCKHRPGLGETCGVDGLCAAGTTCNQVSARCSAKALAGAACGRDGPFECEAGFYCRSAEEDTGPCTPQSAEGRSPCYWDDHCILGTRCVLPEGRMGPGVCRKPSQLGDPCDGNGFEECVLGQLLCVGAEPRWGIRGRCDIPPSYEQPCNGQPAVDGLCLTGECDPRRPGGCRFTKESFPCENPGECGPDTTCYHRNGALSALCSAACVPQPP